MDMAGILAFGWRGSGHGRGDTNQLAGVFEVSLAGGASEQAVMADAVEAFGKTWISKRRMNSSAASVINCCRSATSLR